MTLPKESVFTSSTMEEIVAEANGYGCDVVIAESNELQFDLDTDDAYRTFQRFFHSKLEPKWSDLELSEWNSKSGKGKHVVVKLPEELPITERIALQSMGGSDLGREFASLNCFKNGSKNPILLFKPRVKNDIA